MCIHKTQQMLLLAILILRGDGSGYGDDITTFEPQEPVDRRTDFMIDIGTCGVDHDQETVALF